MKFGTNKVEIIDYLHAKFQLATLSVTWDFEIRNSVGRAYHKIVFWDTSPLFLTSLFSFEIEWFERNFAAYLVEIMSDLSTKIQLLGISLNWYM